MKQLALILTAFIITSVAIAGNSKGKATSFQIDTKASKVYWTGKKVSGEHTGYLSIGNGTLTVEGEKVVGGIINMDLNSIVCTDLEGEWNQKLVGHLKSEDFFSVEKHPEANFKISDIKANANGKYNIEGILTMKGISHQITFPAEVGLENGLVKANGTASIDRTKWDIKYGSGKFFQGLGDKMIKDEFEIRFELKARVNENLTAK